MRKIFLPILLIIILFVFTGCDTPDGIDHYNFVISVGIDKTEDNLLKLSVQLPSVVSSSSGSSGSSQSSNYTIYSVEAQSIDEGITILDNFLNKQINLSHCSALVISEELAREGVKTIFNTFSNNTELRHNCKMIVSSSSAYDVLNNVSNSGEIFSSRLFKYLTNSTDYTGFTVDAEFGDFFKALHNDYYEPTAVYVKISDNTVQIDGIAIFKKEYFVGHIDPISSMAHLITTDNLNKSVITLDNPFDTEEKIDLELSLYKNTDISVNIINNSPFISLKVYPEGTIKSSGSTFNYVTNDNIIKLENTTNDYLEKIIKDYLYDISKNYNSDIVGFKGITHTKYLTKDEFNKLHWDEIFQDSFFEVEVNSKINSSNLFNKE